MLLQTGPLTELQAEPRVCGEVFGVFGGGLGGWVGFGGHEIVLLSLGP